MFGPNISLRRKKNDVADPCTGTPKGNLLILRLRNLCFLIVEDNLYMRRIIAGLLHTFGVRDIREAENGVVALEHFLRFSPDVVILDWSMPIMDGLTFCRKIRQLPAEANPYVPILLLTGLSEKEKVFQARDAGITEFLVKPIAARTLIQRLEEVLLHPRPFIKVSTYCGPDRRRTKNKRYIGTERRINHPQANSLQLLPLLPTPEKPLKPETRP